MPTKRTRRSRGRIVVDPEIWRLLFDDPAVSPFAMFNREAVAEAWAAYKNEVLRDWIKRHPGTRPRIWWTSEAPEPRQRLGGIGIPLCQVWPGFKDTLDKGVPARWGDVDPVDPPTFESEAAYIERLGLFLPRERARVPADNYERVKIRRNVA